MDETLEPLRVMREQMVAFANGFFALLPSLVVGVLILVATWALARAAGGAVARLAHLRHARPSLTAALRTLARTGVWVLGLLVAATVLFPNLTPTKALAGLGLGTIAIGLAFQDIFENFLAGLLILFRKPMRIGDDIECEGVSGRVEEITIRDSHIRQRSGELVLVPNAFLYKNPVRVLTDREARRIEIEVGVAYDTDLDEARRVALGAFEGLETPVAGRPVEAYVTGFDDSSIGLKLRWWARPTPADELASRDEVARALKRALDAAGIEIPFPIRTLALPEPLRIERAARAAEG